PGTLTCHCWRRWYCRRCFILRCFIWLPNPAPCSAPWGRAAYPRLTWVLHPCSTGFRRPRPEPKPRRRQGTPVWHPLCSFRSQRQPPQPNAIMMHSSISWARGGRYSGGSSGVGKRKALLGRVSDVDLRLLRIFQTVVNCGGFSAAEIDLGIGRSTISTHIGELEARLGTRLCQRGRGGFALTARGKKIYEASLGLMKSL